MDIVRDGTAMVDYGTLENALPNPKMFPSDIDGILERKGRVLFIECKPHQEELSTGQDMLLRNLKLLNPALVTVIHVHISGSRTAAGAYYFHPLHVRQANADGTWSPWQDCDLKEFRRLYRRWFDRANQGAR